VTELPSLPSVLPTTNIPAYVPESPKERAGDAVPDVGALTVTAAVPPPNVRLPVAVVTAVETFWFSVIVFLSELIAVMKLLAVTPVPAADMPTTKPDVADVKTRSLEVVAVVAERDESVIVLPTVPTVDPAVAFMAAAKAVAEVAAVEPL
jgi:hypothetical protein